jgi:hypothetical protein
MFGSGSVMAMAASARSSSWMIKVCSELRLTKGIALSSMVTRTGTEQTFSYGHAMARSSNSGTMVAIQSCVMPPMENASS